MCQSLLGRSSLLYHVGFKQNMIFLMRCGVVMGWGFLLQGPPNSFPPFLVVLFCFLHHNQDSDRTMKDIPTHSEDRRANALARVRFHRGTSVFHQPGTGVQSMWKSGEAIRALKSSLMYNNTPQTPLHINQEVSFRHLQMEGQGNQVLATTPQPCEGTG